jgi:hypothetical protein
VLDFDRWSRWLEATAHELRAENVFAELKRGGLPTAKPCCSFRVETNFALGQFDVWVTGEADFDVMDAQSKAFIYHSWAMLLDDNTFEGAFKDFLNRSLGGHLALPSN